MSQAESPVLVQEIPAMQANEALPIKLLNLNNFIKNQSVSDGELRFTLSQADGKPLPNGLVCTQSGEFTGVPTLGTHQAEPYSILVIAKNDADVPLIAYFDLHIGLSKRAKHEVSSSDSPEAPLTQRNKAPDLEDQLKEYLSLIDEDLAKDFSDDDLTQLDGIKQAIEKGDFYGNYSEAEFIAMFVDYLVKKYAALRLYDAYNFDEYYNEMPTWFETKNGWSVKDEKVSLLTMNPNAVSDTFSTGPFIEAAREMIQKAADRGWQCVGAMGPYADLAERLVQEHNQKESLKPAGDQRIMRLNNPMKDGLWLEDNTRMEHQNG